MTRLAATMRCDVRLQLRNGFYWAGGLRARRLGSRGLTAAPVVWAPLMPPLILGNLVMATFFFMGGLVLLEKGEGTLEAQVVTPLTGGEYLASKVLTLTALSVVENLAVVLLTHGPAFRWVPFVAGMAAASVMFCLIGFIVVARYDSINEYLFPTMIYTTLFYLPVLDYAGLWETRWMLLHPLQAPLVLMEGAFYPLHTWEWFYGSVLFDAVDRPDLPCGAGARSVAYVVARVGAR